MIREHLFQKTVPTDALFRWRGGAVSRLEGLSDGVFAVTLTLLIVSLSVPTTYYELWETVRDLPVFLLSFVALMMAWRSHYIFFRRYGLEDFLTSTLNAGFLFLILFYAYPLKFLATFLWHLILGVPSAGMFAVPASVDASTFFTNLEQRAGMMYFYGAGVIGVFGVLFLMTWRAWSLREALELDALERYQTCMSLRALFLTTAVASLSLLTLVFGAAPGVAGIVYFLMAPIHTAHGIWSGTRLNRMARDVSGPGVRGR